MAIPDVLRNGQSEEEEMQVLQLFRWLFERTRVILYMWLCAAATVNIRICSNDAASAFDG